MNNSTKTLLAILAAVIVFGICCICVVGFAGLFLISSNRQVQLGASSATSTPLVIRPTPPTSTAPVAPATQLPLETPALVTPGTGR